MANESYVGIAPDSTGKKVRNLQAQVLQADGSVATVHMQVVALADESGNPVRVLDGRDLIQQLLDEMRATRVGIQMLVEWVHPAASVITVPPLSPGIRITVPTVEDHELIEIARDLRADEDT